MDPTPSNPASLTHGALARRLTPRYPPHHRQIQSCENLQRLTRRIRELWIQGPLRGPSAGETELDAQLASEQRAVAALTDSLDAAALGTEVRALGGDFATEGAAAWDDFQRAYALPISRAAVAPAAGAPPGA